MMKRTDPYFTTSQVIIEYVLLTFIGFLITLALLFPSRVPEWKSTTVQLILAACLYAGVSRVMKTKPVSVRAISFHTVSILTLLSFLFDVASRFQHVFVSQWNDELLLSWESAITGTESTLFLQPFISPLLTEWMMMSYVLYVAMLPLVAYACHRAGGAEASTAYLLNLTLANIACYVGFILFPVAGPMCYYPEKYTVPLQGEVFTLMGEWIRNNVHKPGGCLPSPHCAATAVMIASLCRHNRKWFIVLLPILTSIFPATVYGRYHYLSDAIAGIAVALVVLKLSPQLIQQTSRSAHSRTLLAVNRSYHHAKEGVS